MTLTNSPEFAVWMMLAGLAACTVWYDIRLGKHRTPGAAALLAAALGSLCALAGAKFFFLLHDLGANLFDGYFDEITDMDPAMLSFIGGCAGFTGGTALAAKLSGIRPAKALDLFAAPGCVFLFLARIAEAGMDMIGMGSDVETPWLRFFPLTLQNSWGDAYLSVFALEAAWALICLIPALRTVPERDGAVFTRTAVWLLGAQIGFETLTQYPYIRTFIYSFVSLEQVLCAVLLLALVIPACIRNRKWAPAAATAALLGLSAFFQFYRDNKIELFFEEGWEWALENTKAISTAAFVLISAGLVWAGDRALKSPEKQTPKA